MEASLRSGGASTSLPLLHKAGVDAWLRAHGKVVRPELTKRQKQELKECFNLIDADGSGAIDVGELVTAFTVLGLRVRRSEVEKILSKVGSGGSGEVEYPEFVQIMTLKLDSQVQEATSEEKTNKQSLPFQLLAQAYRRKKLMEAVMGGDKAAQERLRAKAEEAEAERQTILLATEAEKKNPVLRYDEKKIRTISDVEYRRMKRVQAQKKLGTEKFVPDYFMDQLDDDLKQMILETIEDDSVPSGSSLGGIEELFTEDRNDQSLSVSQHDEHQNGNMWPNDGYGSRHETLSPILGKQPHRCFKGELFDLGQHRDRVRHKPVLEQQLLHLRAVKSIHDYARSDALNAAGAR
eukprot:c24133_g1_i2 orf=220-1269(+)